jgi:hypothetical protein
VPYPVHLGVKKVNVDTKSKFVVKNVRDYY